MTRFSFLKYLGSVALNPRRGIDPEGFRLHPHFE
jgi:hypothetical protein